MAGILSDFARKFRFRARIVHFNSFYYYKLIGQARQAISTPQNQKVLKKL